MPSPREITARIDALRITDDEAHYLVGVVTDMDPDLMEQALEHLLERRAAVSPQPDTPETPDE